MTKKTRVLLAEDDDSIRELIQEVLLDEGFEVHPVNNGHAASLLIKKFKFDLIITDFRMPQMNGVELLEWCQYHETFVPVLFMTATDHLSEEENLALSRFKAKVVKKPLNLSLFLETIHAALALELVCTLTL